MANKFLVMHEVHFVSVISVEFGNIKVVGSKVACVSADYTILKDQLTQLF